MSSLINVRTSSDFSEKIIPGFFIILHHTKYPIQCTDFRKIKFLAAFIICAFRIFEFSLGVTQLHDF
ncbi:MAG: hypothetical protein BWK80_42650 [Desulfobacteraceae bacterium IS3]|nr:MAG: hypothetical protein BWK80_42650 [Desulfobacteraceae bacterium IS3]